MLPAAPRPYERPVPHWQVIAAIYFVVVVWASIIGIGIVVVCG